MLMCKTNEYTVWTRKNICDCEEAKRVNDGEGRFFFVFLTMAGQVRP